MKKKVIIEKEIDTNNIENENIEIEQQEQEQEQDKEDIFGEIPTAKDIKYFIYRLKQGKEYFITTISPPLSIQDIALNFGAGVYKIYAKNKGKYYKSTEIYIDDIYNTNNEKIDNEDTYIEKLLKYKQIFQNENNSNSKILELIIQNQQQIFNILIQYILNLNLQPSEQNNIIDIIKNFILPEPKKNEKNDIDTNNKK